MSVRMKSSFEVKIDGKGVKLDVALSDGPDDLVEIWVGSLHIVGRMSAGACAAAAAFFDAASLRRVAENKTAAKARIAEKKAALKKEPPKRSRKGFTLVELLVVIVIIGLVSAAALPAVLPALAARQSREAARQLSAALAGCRDRAIATGQPSGIRLLPDPAFPLARLSDGSIDPAAILAYSRWVPIEPAPEYTEGAVSVFPSDTYTAAVRTVNGYADCPCLVVEECVKNPTTGAPNAPTSWFWNLRVGDKIQLNNAGRWYTIVGPMLIQPSGTTWSDGTVYANPEMFVNSGPPGWNYNGNPKATPWPSPLIRNGSSVEFLLLVNGQDDNMNGWIDEGFDGLDNNGVGGIDEHLPSRTATVTLTTTAPGADWPISGQPGASQTQQITTVCDEWEQEAWTGAAAQGLTNVAYAVRRRPVPSAGAREQALPNRVVIDATTWGTTLERSRLPVDRWSGAVELLIRPDGTAIAQTVYGVPSSISMGGPFLHFWLAERPDLVAPPAVGALPMPQGEWALVTLSCRTGLVSMLEDPAPATAHVEAQQGQ